MVLRLATSLILLAGAAFGQTASDPGVASAILAAPASERADRLRDAVALGAAAPEALLRSLLTPESRIAEITALARAATEGAPLRADRITAATLSATGRGGGIISFRPALAAIVRALSASPLEREAKAAETAEVLAVLIAFFPEESEAGLAALIASLTGDEGGGARLLAALSRPAEPSAVAARPAFTRASAGVFVVAPSTPAQDAPSGN